MGFGQTRTPLLGPPSASARCGHDPGAWSVGQLCDSARRHRRHVTAIARLRAPDTLGGYVGDVLWRARARSREQKLCRALPRWLLPPTLRQGLDKGASDSVFSSPGRPCLTTMRRASLRDQDGCMAP
jgi:hypothetical protein